MMLTSCANERTFITSGSRRSDVKYKNGGASGTISYEDVDKSVMLVTFSKDNENFSCVAIKTVDSVTSINGTSRSTIKYILLKTGALIYHASVEEKDDGAEITFYQGKDITIIEEKSVVPYLFEKGYILADYEINEFIGFCDENFGTILNTEKEIALS